MTKTVEEIIQEIEKMSSRLIEEYNETCTISGTKELQKLGAIRQLKALLQWINESEEG